MARPASRSSDDFIGYPLLAPDEFAEACHHLDRRYCRATLGPLRRRWKLRCCSALSTASSSDSVSLGADYSIYIQIIRPLEDDLDDVGVCLSLEKFSLGDDGQREALEVKGGDDKEEHNGADVVMMEAEENDQCVLFPSTAAKSKPGFGYVTYEVHLHPTYRVPCLWFSLHNLPLDERIFDIDTVFRRLVPDQYKDILRNSGIGGISVDHHPLTGVLTFFLHPCLLGQAIAGFECTKKNYLMVWIGLVGGCVGLWMPKEMALED